MRKEGKGGEKEGRWTRQKSNRNQHFQANFARWGAILVPLPGPREGGKKGERKGGSE